MGTSKATDSVPPSGNAEAGAAQGTAQVVQTMAVEEKHDISIDDKDAKSVKEPDNETKKKKPDASLGNYFVSCCEH